MFSEGKFTVAQPAEGEPVTTLTLTGPTFRETCGDATAARRGKPKRVRRLWGNGHGRFRTAGHYSAATVRGTKWLTEDRCDGTVTRVVRGTVEVEDFTDPPAARAAGGERRCRTPRPRPRRPAPARRRPGHVRACPPAARTSPAPEPERPCPGSRSSRSWSSATPSATSCSRRTGRRPTSAPGSGATPRRRRALVSHVATYTLAFAPALAWLAGDLGAAGTAALAAGVFLPHLVQDDGRLLGRLRAHASSARSPRQAC